MKSFVMTLMYNVKFKLPFGVTGGDRMRDVILEEAALIRTLHPSKDARAFAETVYKYLNEALNTPSPEGSALNAGYMRKAFICRGCKTVYMDMPVSQCDCSMDESVFDEYEVKFTKLNKSI